MRNKLLMTMLLPLAFGQSALASDWIDYKTEYSENPPVAVEIDECFFASSDGIEVFSETSTVYMNKRGRHLDLDSEEIDNLEYDRASRITKKLYLRDRERGYKTPIRLYELRVAEQWGNVNRLKSVSCVKHLLNEYR